VLVVEGDYAGAAELMQVCVDFELAIGHPEAAEDAARLAEVRGLADAAREAS
jgi:hypothetical protein